MSTAEPVAAQPSEPVELAPSETAGARLGAGRVLPGGARRPRAAQGGRATRRPTSWPPSSASPSAPCASTCGRSPNEGLVAHHDERTGPGRPRRRYCLAPAAESLWPKRYGQLTNQLLGFLEATDPELVARVFAQRGAERARARRGAPGRQALR